MKKVLFSIALASFVASPLLAFAAPTPVSAEEGKDSELMISAVSNLLRRDWPVDNSGL